MPSFSEYKTLFLTCCFAFSQQIFAESTQALQLLKGMTDAMQSRNYHGNFIYISDNKIENMIYVHRNDAGIVSERLYSLNGEAREIIRNNNSLICIWPDTESVVIDNSVIESQLPAQLPGNLENLTINYEFKVLGQQRIADYDTYLVSIKPKDSYRYGYKYWIHSDSNIMLKSAVMNENGQVIEKMMFTQLYIDQVTDEMLLPVASSDDFRSHEVGPRASAALTKVQDSNWQVRMLPHGFTMTMHQRSMTPNVSEHMVFSDGMSSLSVFIEKKAKSDDVLTGYSNMGAVNAFGRYEDAFHITAVGEVPAQTVRLIGEALVLK